ncbi:bifunctional 4-hydroxy-2-oxoglutarate aldolase/2-dehydro-3-deoxy-phosphogluconate aldolase [Pseudonocardia humida]|uniref:Bifunctional 4-hydroxy-2-oxoglutarate aldolase/2-dehydro-3-deoxy-phosphogluconate aldolase n=1 Tax=Pseudonocardia humida TaxID=2800819 RepID=A0ABT1AAD3_9PSEU|nr:bifunctional 4-hydroxy-2-oxoglutarate aldolase/2-dehydro-3-deoxy-phosphogluconate aldolase [Pseudonocardia humida]MCO1659963.1 bifunctional 4-hydroxy-2-oxoglutarate aldolase/2-dehydro-3-deoxy-phosphogluconate aldolase [Pseudonocardia humida]
MDLLGRLAEHPVLGIVRGDDAGAALRTVLALAEEGIGLVEVSLTTNGALGVIERAVAELGDRVGAGTVLTRDDAVRARDAGAAFALTPALGPGVDAAVGLGLPVVAGAFTPTEVLAAVRAGAVAVKVFPASLHGPAYLRALRDPFPDVDLVPVGGVGVEDVRPYLDAGALAVGAGGPLVGDAARGGDLGALRERARAFLAAAR